MKKNLFLMLIASAGFLNTAKAQAAQGTPAPASVKNTSAPDPNIERMRIVNEKIAKEKADAAAKQAERQKNNAASNKAADAQTTH